MQWDLTGSSLGDLPKESGSSLAKRREIARKKTKDLSHDYRRLPEYTGNPSSGQQLSVGKPPRWRVNRPYHRI
ncbi:hypothetical protein BHM03_00049563 [Ensete ventricosum]|nr:hypothetical protein BHM03_00049563 [Ensete ventricosum]